MFMYDIIYEDEIKMIKRSIAVCVIFLVLSIFCLVLSVQWMINPGYDLSSKEELISFESTIREIERDPLIMYSETVLWRLKLENGQNILITESQMNYMTEEEILDMTEGGNITYFVSSTENDLENIEAYELHYEKKEIYSLDEYNAYIKENRKTGFLLFPMSIIGLIIFGVDIYRRIRSLKLLKQGIYLPML